MATLKTSCAALALLFILAVWPLPASAFSEEKADFVLTLSKAEVRQGERVELILSYSGGAEDISAFVVRVDFDDAAFSYQRTEIGGSLKSEYVMTQGESHQLSSIYTSKEPGKTTLQSGELFRYVFSANAAADAGDYPFAVSLEQVVDRTGEAAKDLSLSAAATVQPPLPSDCRLLSLKPASGTLKPEFDPDELHYQLDVPFAVSEIGFEAEVAPGASWKINRKTLGAGGSATDFVLTVTAADGVHSEAYTVTVNRAQKAAAASGKTSSSAKGSSASAGKSSSASSSKSGAAEGKTAAGSGSGSEKASAEAVRALADVQHTDQVGGLSFVMDGGGFTPFLWGALGGVFLVLILYLISLQLKLLTAAKVKEKNDSPPENFDQTADQIQAPAHPVQESSASAARTQSRRPRGDHKYGSVRLIRVKQKDGAQEADQAKR